MRPLTILLGLHVFLSLVLSQGLVRDDGLTAGQKLGQIVLVWFLPLIGAAIVLAMQGQNHSRSELKALLPFPFWYAGFPDMKRSPNSPSPQDGIDDTHRYDGEGACGSD